jgi:hypothetical protein
VCTFAVAAAIAMWGYLLHGYGTRWSRAVGGNWELRFVDTPMSHGGPQASLYRRSRWRSRRVDELVNDSRYYGDDCVIYETRHTPGRRSYYAVCDDHTPLLIARETYNSWILRPDGVQREEWVDNGQRLVRRATLVIPYADIRRRAMAQPPFADDWYKHE